MNHLTVPVAYQISIAIILVSAFISATELLSIPKLYLNFGMPSTAIKNKRRTWITIHAMQASLAFLTCIAFFNAPDIYFKVLFTALTAVTLYSYRKRQAGKDGSDQMRMLALLSYSVCFLLKNEQGQLLSVFFTGGQALISYSTSGIVKLMSPHWRGGNVLAGVLSTYSYGVPKVSSFLSAHPLLEKGMCYSAIVTMLAVPVTFLLPYHAPLFIALFCILCFHVSTAILMGLNDFLFTFPLAYPGIILLHGVIFGI
ncbi:hypothetical protein [Mucilaginibacter sp.]|uniref:hypothetical protein n=1 Tax=Mucilaginibacter sp. TaxID=1882438 RepID=UPI0032661953